MRIQSEHEERFCVLFDRYSELDAKHVQLKTAATSEFRYVIPLAKTFFRASSCTPPTSISDLDRYTHDICNINSLINQVVANTSAGSLIMGPFAQAANSLSNYINQMPDEFCINSSNQEAFDRLNVALSNAINAITRGTGMFEDNLERFVNQAVPLLNNLYNISISISSSSRDFSQVMTRAQQYEYFVNQYQLEIYNLNQRITNLSNQFEQALNAAIGAFDQALHQIETNVEAEAQRFVDSQRATEEAFLHWDSIDGKEGYERYYAIISNVVQVIIPEFNAFISKVPNTKRINDAFLKAQQSVNQIDTGFNSFPDFQPLPSDSNDFPHLRYGSEDRKYGGNAVIGALQKIARTYLNRTNKKIYIGDMQYKHGGKMGIHKSHRNGIDGDVDGIEIGDIPNHDATKALELAKDILSAGPSLIFYASQTTVNDANAWASQNNISGRLQYEENHKKHFHIRMPV